MNNKLLSLIAIIVLFTVFTAVVYAKSSSLLFLNKQKIIVTLKNEADINISKEEISKIPYVKIIKIKYRDEEWSRMVNKMDLPNMQNPFKNEFIIKTKRKANINEIYNKIKELDFVENIKYMPEKEG